MLNNKGPVRPGEGSRGTVQEMCVAWAPHRTLGSPCPGGGRRVCSEGRGLQRWARWESGGPASEGLQPQSQGPRASEGGTVRAELGDISPSGRETRRAAR